MAADGQRHILAIGGMDAGLRDDLPPLMTHALDLSGARGAPRVRPDATGYLVEPDGSGGAAERAVPARLPLADP